jgi:hypothetical protein
MEYRVGSMTNGKTVRRWVRRHRAPVSSAFAVALSALGCGSDDGGPSTGAPSGGTGAIASAGTGGASGAGASGTAGTGGSPSSSGGSEGNPDVGGLAGAGGNGAEPDAADTRPYFSFFVTSQAGLFGLPAGEVAPAPDPANGYGGDLGGLAGADEICTLLARASNPGDGKTWRAFLSTAGLNGADPVDAIDRIGPGPWYNYNGLLLAENVQGLLPQGNDGRPRDADPELAAMFTDENGDDARPNNQVDNHDTLTGSGQDGRLFDDGEGGRVATCEDWTSNTLHGEAGSMFGAGGQVPVGHSWPRGANNGRHWIQDHAVNGCEPGALVTPGPGAGANDFRVGAGGGFGGIYCFALGAVAPPAP